MKYLAGSDSPRENSEFGISFVMVLRTAYSANRSSKELDCFIFSPRSGCGAWIPVLDNYLCESFVLSMRQLVFQVSGEGFLDLIKYI